MGWAMAPAEMEHGAFGLLIVSVLGIRYPPEAHQANAIHAQQPPPLSPPRGSSSVFVPPSISYCPPPEGRNWQPPMQAVRSREGVYVRLTSHGGPSARRSREH